MLSISLFLLTLILGLTSPSAAQQITSAPAPAIVGRALSQALIARASATDKSKAQACEKDEPGCSKKASLSDACKSQYSSAADNYLYCLCTTGYYDALSSCEQCSVTRGAMESVALVSDVAQHSSECEKRSAEFAPGSASAKATPVNKDASKSESRKSGDKASATDASGGALGEVSGIKTGVRSIAASSTVSTHTTSTSTTKATSSVASTAASKTNAAYGSLRPSTLVFALGSLLVVFGVAVVL